MYKKFKDFIKENLDYIDIQNIIETDLKHLRLSDDSLVRHMAKDMLYKVIYRNEEKYHNIIDIIKLQNEINDYIGRKQIPKYSNVEYLSKKSPGAIHIIKKKWNDIKQSIIKQVIINDV